MTSFFAVPLSRSLPNVPVIVQLLPVTLVEVVAWLLAGLVSPLAVTLAVFEVAPAVTKAPLTVMVALPPAGTVPTGQVSVPADTAHVPAVVVTFRTLNPLGRVSVTVTPPAATGVAVRTTSR